MFEVYRWESLEEHGQWRWRVQAGNNRIVADSGESYHNQADCINGARVPMAHLTQAALDGLLVERVELAQEPPS